MHRYFGFWNSNVKAFPKSRKCKISIFPFTLSQQKCCISRNIQRIFKNFFLAERKGTWLLFFKISSVQIFWFCNSNVTTFPTSRKFKNFNFSLYTVPPEMLYLQKYLTNFQKLFLPERRGTWLLCLKIWRAHIFWFFNCNVTTFPTSRKWKNFNFSFYSVPAEMLYPKRILRIFINFFSRERRGRCLFWWKISNAQIFWIWNSNVTTFPTCTKCKNFNVSLYTVPAEMLYLQKYITKFQNLFFG